MAASKWSEQKQGAVDIVKRDGGRLTREQVYEALAQIGVSRKNADKAIYLAQLEGGVIVQDSTPNTNR